LALAELQRAAMLAPKDLRFACVYAASLHSAGRSEAGIAEIDRALSRYPDDPGAMQLVRELGPLRK
jgi:Flp pilus assembly protein TadD